MRLQFEERSQYGKLRYFPLNASARAVVDLTKRKCLNKDEIEHLMLHGFDLEVDEIEIVRKPKESHDKIARRILGYSEGEES